MGRLIFAQSQYFAECHASTLVQLPKNRFFAAWFAGSKEGHADVGIWGVLQNDGQWTTPHLLAKIDQRPHWNPVLFLDQHGILHLFFKVGDTIDSWETWEIVSTDLGTTWSPAHELVPGDRGGRGPVKNKLIVLTSGAWLAPASLERHKQWTAFVDRSDDDGKTWHTSGAIPMDTNLISGEGVIQPTLWESEPGHIHMFLRSSCGHICRSESYDDGHTWSTIIPTDLPNNNSGIDVARMQDGTLALVYNPVKKNWGSRSPLAIALSYDNGRTWPHRINLESEEGEYSYPAIIPTATGMAVTYTWRRKSIAFWQGTMEQISEQSMML